MTDNEKQKMQVEFQRFCSDFYKDIYKALGGKYKVRLSSFKEEPLCPGYYKEGIPLVVVQRENEQPYLVDLLESFASYYGKISYEEAVKNAASKIEFAISFYDKTLE